MHGNTKTSIPIICRNILSFFPHRIRLTAHSKGTYQYFAHHLEFSDEEKVSYMYRYMAGDGLKNTLIGQEIAGKPYICITQTDFERRLISSNCVNGATIISQDNDFGFEISEDKPIILQAEDVEKVLQKLSQIPPRQVIFSTPPMHFKDLKKIYYTLNIVGIPTIWLPRCGLTDAILENYKIRDKFILDEISEEKIWKNR